MVSLLPAVPTSGALGNGSPLLDSFLHFVALGEKEKLLLGHRSLRHHRTRGRRKEVPRGHGSWARNQTGARQLL